MPLPVTCVGESSWLAAVARPLVMGLLAATTLAFLGALFVFLPEILSDFSSSGMTIPLGLAGAAMLEALAIWLSVMCLERWLPPRWAISIDYGQVVIRERGQPEQRFENRGWAISGVTRTTFQITRAKDGKTVTLPRRVQLSAGTTLRPWVLVLAFFEKRPDTRMAAWLLEVRNGRLQCTRVTRSWLDWRPILE